MIRCLLVEDEPLAADLLAEYISKLPFLSLVKICPDALQALSYCREHEVDVIFLDIHLPGLKGLDFIKTLANPPKVIITTAYHQYALQGYELNVVDYLLKPVEFSRFVEAVNKLRDVESLSIHKNRIKIHAEKKTILLSDAEILYIESQKEYIKIQTETKAYLYKYALSKIEEELNASTFLRIHRSFIINLNHLKGFNAAEVDIAGVSLPIGGNYKQTVEARLQFLFGSH